ncbi:hypothetical protein BC828DRAFT_392141 [Blastocladiella britannica]|nr:hypothetical protein BC828DRAFT_392141 [Blastocladiella britannica]
MSGEHSNSSSSHSLFSGLRGSSSNSSGTPTAGSGPTTPSVTAARKALGAGKSLFGEMRHRIAELALEVSPPTPSHVHVHGLTPAPPVAHAAVPQLTPPHPVPAFSPGDLHQYPLQYPDPAGIPLPLTATLPTSASAPSLAHASSSSSSSQDHDPSIRRSTSSAALGPPAVDTSHHGHHRHNRGHTSPSPHSSSSARGLFHDFKEKLAEKSSRVLDKLQDMPAGDLLDVTVAKLTDKVAEVRAHMGDPTTSLPPDAAQHPTHSEPSEAIDALLDRMMSILPQKVVAAFLGLQGITRVLAFIVRTAAAILTWRPPHAERLERKLSVTERFGLKTSSDETLAAAAADGIQAGVTHAAAAVVDPDLIGSRPPVVALLTMAIWTLVCFEPFFLLVAAPLWAIALLPTDPVSLSLAFLWPVLNPRVLAAGEHPFLNLDLGSSTSSLASSHPAGGEERRGRYLDVEPTDAEPRGRSPTSRPLTDTEAPTSSSSDSDDGPAESLTERKTDPLPRRRRPPSLSPTVWTRSAEFEPVGTPRSPVAPPPTNLPALPTSTTATRSTTSHAKKSAQKSHGPASQALRDLLEMQGIIFSAASRVRLLLELMHLNSSIRVWAAAVAKPAGGSSPSSRPVLASTQSAVKSSLGISALPVPLALAAITGWLAVAVAGATVPAVWVGGMLAMTVFSDPGLFYLGILMPAVAYWTEIVVRHGAETGTAVREWVVATFFVVDRPPPRGVWAMARATVLGWCVVMTRRTTRAVLRGVAFFTSVAMDLGRLGVHPESDYDDEEVEDVLLVVDNGSPTVVEE